MRLKQWIIVTVLMVGAVLSAVGYTDRALNWCGMRYLSQANNSYLEDAFNKSLSGFLILSSIKSGLAVVEGSEVGVGFNLELGDIVQPVYDYVDIAWKAALAGGSIIVGMQLALKGMTLVDHWTLAILLLLLSACRLTRRLPTRWNRIHTGLKQALRFVTTLSLAFYLLLPLSVTGAAALSHHITRPLLQQAQQELERIENEICPKNMGREALTDLAAESFSSPTLKNRLADTGTGVHMLISFLKTETDQIAALAFKLIAAYLFDCILFPLLFGLILMTMLRGGVNYFFDLSRIRQ
ncbi:MAG: hypothetical protein PVH87_27810 [Desulfobacteraceae bacterium]